MKPTWKHWIEDFSRPLKDTYWGKYYHFKSFKVYWAYRWSIAERLDFDGVLDPKDRTMTIKQSIGYRYRFIK